MWKSRLRAAIDAGRSDVTPEQVEPDNLCAFGKWLHGLPSSDRNSEHFKKVQPLHAAFHKEAANVLRLALSGKKPEASKPEVVKKGKKEEEAVPPAAPEKGKKK